VRLLLPPPGPGEGELSDDDLARLYAAGNRGTPLVRVNAVTSADGAGTLDGRSEGLSGPDDKRVFRVLRAECDALLVGAGTLRDEAYGPLTLDAARRASRRARGLPDTPTLVVVSGSLDLAPDLPALAQAPVRPVVLTSAAADPRRRAALEEVADVMAPGTDGATVDLGAALGALTERGLCQVLCEGGPRLFGALTTADLVDELCLTVSPLLAGPGPGRITAGSPAAAPPAAALSAVGLPSPRALELRHVLTGGGSLLLRYTRPRPVLP